MKIRDYILRAMAVLVLVSCCLIVSCNEQVPSHTDTDTETEVNVQQTDDFNKDSGAVTDAITDAVDKDETETLSLKWNLGYVASSSHGTKPNQLVAGSGGGNYSYTDVFTVPKAGTTITFTDDNTNSGGDNGYASSNAYVVSSWKKDGEQWVLDLDSANYAGSSTVVSDILISFDNGVATYSYTTTLNNESLRLCYRSGETSGFRPAEYPEVRAAVTGKPGTALGKLALKQWFEDSKASYYSKILEGVTVNALGDSYFEGNGLEKDYVWLSLMAKKYGMDMNNYGKNGSTVSNYVTKYNPMCDRFDSMTETNTDIILLEGGRNDFNQNVPIGTADSYDEATYSGALNVIIDGLQAKYPDAMIVCVSSWNFPNATGKLYTYVDYADAMEAVATRRGVYFIRACDPAVSGIDMRSSAFRAQYCMKSTDVSHLNLEGMKIAMTNFEKILARYYEDFLGRTAT
ncbi:MAG: SGNH/GDSL hydrolase family protein [Clostridia bacterium]|nr:SGNH/GDSL hydrolase family protein [Clostridia bacterium]